MEDCCKLLFRNPSVIKEYENLLLLLDNMTPNEIQVLFSNFNNYKTEVKYILFCINYEQFKKYFNNVSTEFRFLTGEKYNIPYFFFDGPVGSNVDSYSDKFCYCNINFVSCCDSMNESSGGIKIHLYQEFDLYDHYFDFCKIEPEFYGPKMKKIKLSRMSIGEVDDEDCNVQKKRFCIY